MALKMARNRGNGVSLTLLPGSCEALFCCQSKFPFWFFTLRIGIGCGGDLHLFRGKKREGVVTSGWAARQWGNLTRLRLWLHHGNCYRLGYWSENGGAFAT